MYTLKMIDLLWRDEVEEMLNDKSIYKISTPEIVEHIKFYEKAVESLLRIKKTKEQKKS